jgi:hypothetical protein
MSDNRDGSVATSATSEGPSGSLVCGRHNDDNNPSLLFFSGARPHRWKFCRTEPRAAEKQKANRGGTVAL